MNLRIPVQVDPQVIIPDHISSVGIVDRSHPPGGAAKATNVLEGVITGEGIMEDRKGARACVAGVCSRLSNDKLVDSKVLDTVTVYGTGAGTMPLPLPWGDVERICKTNKVDALLVLEAFDTDQTGTVTTSAINQIRNVAQGGTLRPPNPAPRARVRVKFGYRLYDPANKTILDEAQMNDFFSVRNTGSVIPDLGEFAKRGAIQESAYAGGYVYGDRFLPKWIRLNREFYQRKGHEMKRATRMVEVNRWEDAIAVWEPLTKGGNTKLAGRACYNMAVAAEVQGNVPLAIEWAERAYADFGDKRARDYVRILKRRL